MSWWHISTQNIFSPTIEAESEQARVVLQWEPCGTWMLYQCGAIRCVFKSKWQTRILKRNDILQTFDIAVGFYAFSYLNLNLWGISLFLSHHRYLSHVASLQWRKHLMPPFLLYWHILSQRLIKGSVILCPEKSGYTGANYSFLTLKKEEKKRHF